MNTKPNDAALAAPKEAGDGELNHAAVVAAIDAEPEFPSAMPDAMWAKVRDDKDAVEELMRIAVRATKRNIKARLAAANPPGDQRQEGEQVSAVASDSTHGVGISGDLNSGGFRNCDGEGSDGGCSPLSTAQQATYPVGQQLGTDGLAVSAEATASPDGLTDRVRRFKQLTRVVDESYIAHCGYVEDPEHGEWVLYKAHEKAIAATHQKHVVALLREARPYVDVYRAANVKCGKSQQKELDLIAQIDAALSPTASAAREGTDG